MIRPIKRSSSAQPHFPRSCMHEISSSFHSITANAIEDTKYMCTIFSPYFLLLPIEWTHAALLLDTMRRSPTQGSIFGTADILDSWIKEARRGREFPVFNPRYRKAPIQATWSTARQTAERNCRTPVPRMPRRKPRLWGSELHVGKSFANLRYFNQRLCISGGWEPQKNTRRPALSRQAANSLGRCHLH